VAQELGAEFRRPAHPPIGAQNQAPNPRAALSPPSPPPPPCRLPSKGHLKTKKKMKQCVVPLGKAVRLVRVRERERSAAKAGSAWPLLANSAAK
jgi:hypothetical protein